MECTVGLSSRWHPARTGGVVERSQGSVDGSDEGAIVQELHKADERMSPLL